MNGQVVADNQRCTELAQLSCVFIVALGRTGSTHLLRLLNTIPGYRLSGETDNAWVYLGWWFAEQEKGKRSLSQQDLDRPLVVRQRQHQRQEHWIGKHLGKGLRAGARAMDSTITGSICAMRELMLTLHNPSPHARVFGFKEIYSPFVRDPMATREVLDHGVDFLRMLFPRAKFIFHARRNLTRAASSDFWNRDGSILTAAEKLKLMKRTVGTYFDYVAKNPTHAFATTLEGLVDHEDPSEVERLFAFLGEPLTSRLRRAARSKPDLRDWRDHASHAIVIRATNGSIIRVQRRSYSRKTKTKGHAKGPHSASKKAVHHT